MANHIYGLASVIGLLITIGTLLRLRTSVNQAVASAHEQQLAIALVDSTKVFEVGLQAVERSMRADTSGQWTLAEIDHLLLDIRRAHRLLRVNQGEKDIKLEKALSRAAALARSSASQLQQNPDPILATEILRGYLRGDGADQLARVLNIHTDPERQRD